MYDAIAKIKQRTPPHTISGEVFNENWVPNTLKAIAMQIVAQARDDSKLHAILDETVYVVLNFTSIIHGSKRWTFTLANMAAFEVQDFPIDGERKDNNHHMINFSRDSENRTSQFECCEADQKVKQNWSENWKRYLEGDDLPLEYTLNELMLRRSVQPKPFVLSWDQIEKEKNISVPLFLKLNSSFCDKLIKDLEENKKINFSQLKMNERNVLGDVSIAFWESYAGESEIRDWMYNSNTTENEAMFRVTAQLLKHFRLKNSGCFVSIPSFVTTLHHPYGDKREASALRSVVSYSLKDPGPSKRAGKKRAIHRNAFNFFSGIANEILKDLMVHEYAYFLKFHSEGQQKRLLNGAAHPIKSRLMSAHKFTNKLVSATESKHRYYKKPDGVERFDYERLQQEYRLIEKAHRRLRDDHRKTNALAVKVRNNVSGAARRLYLIHFRGKLLRYVDSVAEVKSIADQNARENGPCFSLKKIIQASIVDAIDKEALGIELRPENIKCLDGLYVPARLNAGPLKEFSDEEALVIQSIFDEIMENAASYGMPIADTDSPKLWVDIVMSTRLTATGHLLTITNFIDLRRKRVRLRVDRSLLGKRVLLRSIDSSGLSLAVEMAETLQLCKLYEVWDKVETGGYSYTIGLEFENLVGHLT